MSSAAVGARISVKNARELVAHFENEIATGRLPPGSDFPSVRQLAQLSGLSPSTASAAVAELRLRGLLITESRRRSRVADSPPLLVPPLASPPVPPGITDLRHGGPDRTLLPDLRPQLRKAIEELTEPRLYGLPQVDPDLETLASERFRNAGITPTGIAACAGALNAVEIALVTNLRPGDAVAVEDPGYADLYALVRTLGLRLLPMAVDDEGPVPGELKRLLAGGVRAVALTPTGQNPFGSSLSPERADSLHSLLASHKEVLVIEDQHLVGLTPVCPPLAARCQRWLVVETLAKAYGPDLRLSLATGDATTVARVKGRMAVAPGWVSHLIQRTAVQLLNDDALTGTLLGVGQTYDQRRGRLLEELSKREITAHGRSGLNVWIPVQDEGAVALTLAARGLAIAPGSVFRLQSAPAIRVTTSTLSEGADEVAEAICAAVVEPRGRAG